LVLDGYQVQSGDRILIKDQTDSRQNGVYLCTTAPAVGVQGSFIRDNDVDTARKLAAAIIQVNLGTAIGGTAWICQAKGTDTLGTSAITFKQLSTGSSSSSVSTLTGNLDAGTPDSVFGGTVSVDGGTL
jgi:hypothetical protein